MDPSVSLALSSALLFLVLSSKFAISIIRRVLGLTDDMSVVARTILFGLLIMPISRMV
jgi:hypothetical protein